MSPTARALAILRKWGWTAGVVEKHLAFPKPFGKKHDFLGCIDIIACHHSPKLIIGLQVTTAGSNAEARMKKALAEPRLRAWLAAGGQFQVWGFLKRGARWGFRRKRVHVSFLYGIQVSEWSEFQTC